MTSLNRCLFAVIVFLIVGCTASFNGVGIDTSEQTYFMPHAASSDEVAIVYIYWNQPEVEQWFSRMRTPRWSTRVNGKTNAKLELGSYSVVEVNPGSVRIGARRALGGNFDNLSTRDPSMSLSAKAGEIYFVRASLEESTLGLEMRLQQVFDEREAYNFLYGTKYQQNQQESMLY